MINNLNLLCSTENSDIDGKLKLLLDDIANCIHSYHNKIDINHEYGVYGGYSGLSLFFYYYSRFLDNKAGEIKAKEFLMKAFGIVNKKNAIDVSLCEGLAGLYSTSLHLLYYNFINDEEIELNNLFDKTIIKCLYRGIQNKDYDFFYGVVGYLYYFYTKYRGSQSNSDKETIITILDIIADKIRIDNKHFAYYGGVENTVNLGIPHGISGFMLLLIKLKNAGIDSININYIINNLCSILLCFTSRITPITYFPHMFDITSNIEDLTENSRMGWCYGDLGCATALIEYARCFHNEEVYNKALSILIHSTNRKELYINNVFDAGLCHGSSGIAVIYNKIFNITKLDIFKSSADYWYAKTIDLGYHKDGLAGFCRARKLGDKIYYKNDISLLTGITGIGLSIISKLSSNNSSWEEFLLL